jgi:hypothetical protein
MKILLRESQMIRVVKRELGEEITGGSIIVYHRTKLTKENYKLLNNGFVPGDGQMYGRGLYSTYELKDQFNSNMEGYGSTIIKFQVTDTSKILILDESEQLKVFGKRIGLLDQIKKILKGGFNAFYKVNKVPVQESIKLLEDKNKLTSEAAYYLSTNVRKFQLLFDGLVFTGRNDGRVLVLFETTLASPLQYVDTRGLQQGDKFEWTSLKNKDSYGLGKDKRGMNKLDNYIKFRPSDIVFSELKDKDKKDFVKAKVKSNVPMQQDEYLFWVNETTPASEELEKINDRMVSIKGNALEFIVNPSEAVIKKALYTFPRSIQYLDNPTEEQQLTSINNDPSTFQFIKNPTDTVVEEAIYIRPSNIQYIPNPTEKQMIIAVNARAESIRFIKNPPEAVQLVAVTQDGESIQFIKDPTEKVEFAAVKTSPSSIAYIPNPSEELQLYVLERNYRSIAYVANPTEKVQLLAVQQDGALIRYFVKNSTPSEAVQLAAVTNTGFALQYLVSLGIKPPSDKVIMTAVKQNGMAIQYIPDPSEELQFIAVEQKPENVRYIKNPTQKIQTYVVEKSPREVLNIKNVTSETQLLALKLDGQLINMFHNPSPEVQLIAVQSNPRAILQINNPTEEAQIAAVKAVPTLIKNIYNPSKAVQMAAAEGDPVAVMSMKNRQEKIDFSDVENLKGLTHRELSTISLVSRTPEAFKKNPKMLDVWLNAGTISQPVYDMLKEKLGLLNEEVFRYSDLSDDEKEKVYDIFKTSYENSTGTSWDSNKFSSRANGWTFFGDKSSGFVVLRKQNSGMNKLTGVAGDLKSISMGISDINALNEPVWGMADKRISSILTKKFNYYTPPAFILKLMMKKIPSSVFGDAEYEVNNDGSVTFKYSDVGDATKYFFANKQYYKQIYPTILDSLSGMSSMVANAVKFFFKSFF